MREKKKHILYIHQYFKTPKEPGGTRSYWISKALIDKGFDVTIITTSSTIKVPKSKVVIDGINVIYLKVPYNQKMSVFKRLKSFFLFMFHSLIASLNIKGVDLVLATSTPLTVGFPALMLKLLKGKKFIFEVRDLWPEVPIQMGGLNNKYFKYLAKLFEKIIYKNAIHIVALSPGMADGVLKYECEEKVTIIPNMAKIKEFWPRNKNFDLMIKFCLSKDSFKIIHFGALGEANGAMNIIKGAQFFKNDSEVEFVFIGGGSKEYELIEYCKENNLDNIHFLGKFPMEEVSEIVNFCDVSVVSFKDIPILYTNSPNKLFDSLSAGKPIIVNSAGWTKELVENNNCGMYVNPQNAIELFDKINLLRTDSIKYEKMSENSRILAETKYDKDILCHEYVELISAFIN
jgi:glycosyltransferase involved in cell wall biosynthesis